MPSELPSLKYLRRRRVFARWALATLVAAGAVVLSGDRPARAQAVSNRLENDFGDLMRLMVEFATQVGGKSRGQAISLLNQIELFNVEAEIDRMVGNPWELSDSTAYKLKLAPLHVAYPVYDQMVAQMTRLDDIRSRRIQNLTVDSVGLITVNLDILNGEQSGSELANSLVHYFDAREFLDLGVFLLSQQPFFPETQDEWDASKHRIAQHRGSLALGAAGLGALFELGALSDSGNLTRCASGGCKLGWYGSFSHLGYHLQPSLRGGLTAEFPWIELAAGLLEQVRPSPDGAGSVLEMAVRESWLNRYTSVSGWNSFGEAAVRRVISSEPQYQRELFTARGGFFLKREHPFRWRRITFRSSIEAESNVTGSLRYALGLGIDCSKPRLSAVFQSSRTDISYDTGTVRETRAGLFLAGTVESPDEYFVEAMNVNARLARETWNRLLESEKRRQVVESEMRVLAAAQTPAYRMARVFEALRASTAESEIHRARLATALADYLESRRTAYSLKQWQRSPDGLHGPLDGELLEAAETAVLARLSELAVFLQSALPRLQSLRDQSIEDHDERDRQWRRESEAVSDGLRLYSHYLTSVRRIDSAGHGWWMIRQIEPLDSRVMRKLLTLIAQPLQ